jgi:hypothetical protein
MTAFPRHPVDRSFYTTMAVVPAVVIVVGFANTYGPKVISGSTPVPPIIHLHAVLFTCWLVLFIAQALLVARGQVLAHMRLGIAGMVLAGLMLATGLAAAIGAARAGHKVCVFSALVAAGWWWRRRPQAHKRLMLSATVAGLMPPGISRLPGVAGHDQAIAGLVMAFLLVGPVYDLATRKRIHPAYAGLLLAILIVPPVVLQLSGTEAWHAVAAWMMR